MPRNHRYLWPMLLVIGAAVVAACAPSTVKPAITSTSTPMVVASTALPAAIATTAVPSATPTTPPAPTVVPPTSVPLPTEQQLAQLKDQILQQLINGQPSSPDQPIGVNVLPLTSTGTLAPLYAAYSTGSIMDLLPDGRHILALYVFADGRWDEVQQLSLEASDYVDEAGVQQVLIEPSHLWLEVQSGAGAHSGVYDLFAFDPINRSVAQHITSFSSAPGAGYIADVNGDSQLDVVLDATDYYVFCYACGVTKPQYRVLAWDGAQLSEVTLSTLSDVTPPAAQQANNEAVQLARAGLWQGAQAAIEQAKTLETLPVVRWNAALIDLHAQAYRDQVEAQSFPLLNNIFYGDYAAAIEVLRAYPPDQIFSPAGPLISGTVAEGWIDQLAQWVTGSADAAIQAKPDLAAAHFLRGWAAYLRNPDDPRALNDIQRAAELDPAEALYAQSVVYLKP